MLKINGNGITNIYIGNQKIEKAYLGNQLIWHECYPSGTDLYFRQYPKNDDEGTISYTASQVINDRVFYYYRLHFSNRQLKLLPSYGKVRFEYQYIPPFISFNPGIDLKDLKGRIGNSKGILSVSLTKEDEQRGTTYFDDDLLIGDSTFGPPGPGELIVASSAFYDTLSGYIKFTILP